MFDNDAIVRAVRTWVTLAVTGVMAWLAARGVVVGEDASAGLIGGAAAVAGGIVYTVIAFLEAKVSSRFGWLLGRPKVTA